MGSRKPKLGRTAAASVSPASRRRRPLKRNRRLQKAPAHRHKDLLVGHVWEKGGGALYVYI